MGDVSTMVVYNVPQWDWGCLAVVFSTTTSELIEKGMQHAVGRLHLQL